ncbi:hypothetical protein [Alkalilacustris brevis]|uniref:hypothetical protein n=1 Tax=Alkalilacustris brevis TaxID=2026338 RepID=UPI000E0D8667|nr:hypothetical protein [Alkalilacustris brevis]
MLTTFTVWAATGLSVRTVLGHVLRVRWRRRLAIPQSLAGAAIYTAGALSLFALVPFAPSLVPVPFGLIFGFFILDAVLVKA